MLTFSGGQIRDHQFIGWTGDKTSFQTIESWGNNIIRGELTPKLPSIPWYKSHPIPKHKRFSSRLAVAFAQSTEATC